MSHSQRLLALKPATISDCTLTIDRGQPITGEIRYRSAYHMRYWCDDRCATHEEIRVDKAKLLLSADRVTSEHNQPAVTTLCKFEPNRLGADCITPDISTEQCVTLRVVNKLLIVERK